MPGFTLMPKSPPLRSLLAIAIGGIAMGLTPAPAHLWPLAWVALLPLWLGLRRRSAVLPRRLGRWLSLQSPWLQGVVWGIGYHGLALSWITGLHPLTWMGVPWLASVAIALFCWLFITLWGAVLVGIWAEVVSRVAPLEGDRQSQSGPTAWLSILVGTALWCALEVIWSIGPLYWTSLSYTQSPYNLAILHLGQLSGPLTVTAAIVAVNGCLAAAWRHLQSQSSQLPGLNPWLTAALALVLSSHLLGLGLYYRPLNQSSDAALTIGIIQGNVPTRIKLYEEGLLRARQSYVNGYETLADQGVDAVLTPEGALPIFWPRAGRLRTIFEQAVRERGVIVWLGTFAERQERITQSLLTLNPNGQVTSRYDKIKLVPLGEYVPFQSVLGGLIDRLSPIEASMLPGELRQVFDTPFGRAIVGICYESAFAEIFRHQAQAGGEFILTASNNDPYSAVMMAQHHAQDLMRAIETDRWAVRATNTGYSGVIDPHGTTQWISGVQTYELHAAPIYRRQTQTLYVRWGNWLTPLLLVGAGLGWLRYQLGHRRQI